MPKKQTKTPIKKIFNPIAKAGKKTAGFLWVCSKIGATAMALCASISTLAIVGDPDWTSQPIEEYADENGIDQATLSGIDEDDIRIYHKANPLSYFHVPGYFVYSTVRDLYTIEGFADIDGDHKSSEFEKAAVSGLVTVIGYPFLFYQSYQAAFGSLMTSTVAFSASDNYSDNGRCHIMPPGEIDAIELVSAMTDIPEQYVTASSATAEEINTFIILHEARHCDGYAEGDADIYALENIILSPERQSEMTDTMKYIRAVSAFSRRDIIFPIENAEHATAPFIDAWQNQYERPWSSDVEEATENLYTLIGERAEMFPETNYAFHVYDIMHDLQNSGQLEKNPLMKRSAELYIEGMEHLTPTAAPVQKRLQDKQKSEPAKIASTTVRFLR